MEATIMFLLISLCISLLSFLVSLCLLRFDSSYIPNKESFFAHTVMSLVPALNFVMLVCALIVLGYHCVLWTTEKCYDKIKVGY